MQWFFQITEIVSTLENSDVEFYSELKAVSNNILPLWEKTETSDEKKEEMIFICNKFLVNSNLGQHQDR